LGGGKNKIVANDLRGREEKRKNSKEHENNLHIIKEV
jgi:hypothetical protein